MNNVNTNGRMLVRGLVSLILISMFLSGVFMIVEGAKNDPASEPQKKWFGTAHIIAAAFFAIAYIVSLAP